MMNRAWAVFAALVIPYLDVSLAAAAEEKTMKRTGGVKGEPGVSMTQDVVSFETLLERRVPSSAAPGRATRPKSRLRHSGQPQVSDGEIPVFDEALAASLEGDALFSPASVGPPSPAASLSFAAATDDGTRFNPDTQGAVGPEHLMVTVSSEVRVQNRSGGAISTMSLQQFWSGLGNYLVFDPRVLYDPYSQRWIHTAVANPGQPSAGLLVAVSQTANPTGLWRRHFIGLGTTNNIYPESPNVGFTRDWITIQANMFDNTNFGFFSSDIWVFNKTNLYNGPGASYRHFRYAVSGLGPNNAPVPGVTYDPSEDVQYLVSMWTGNYVDQNVGSIGLLRVFTISGTPDAPVFTPGPLVVGSSQLYNPPWGDFDPLGENFAPQLGSTNKIFIGDSRIQNVVVRNGSIWCAHHVFLPYDAPNRSSVQWFEFSAGGTVFQRGRVDDGTGVKFYAYPSIGVNEFSDVLIGYSRFGADQFPSANYSFRGFEDGPGSLRADTVLKAGEAKFDVNDRGIVPWGDWSATVVDPSGIDLWTIQQYAAAPVGGVDRWGTWWGLVTPSTSIALTMGGSPGTVLASGNVTYTIQLVNNYAQSATGVRVVDTLPSGAAFVSAVPSQGACTHSGGVVTCEMGLLPGGAQATVTVVARLNTSGTAVNQATVTTLGLDDNPADNSATVQTTVNPASDLAVTVSDSPDPVALNGTLTYDIAVTNAGPSAAPGVFVTNTLPAGVTFLSASTGQGSYSRSGSTVVFNLGTLLPSGGVNLVIQVTSTTVATLTNRVVVISSSVDPVPANNSALAVTRANSSPTISTIAGRTINEDSNTGLIPFTIGDAETPATSLTLLGFSSAPAVIPPANIVFGGSGSSRTVTITPALNASGSANISIVVADADGGRATNTFTLNVSPVNDPPLISDTGNQVIAEDGQIGPLSFTVSDVETPSGSLVVSATSSNPLLVPLAAIVLGGSGGNRTVSITPAANQFGSATISLNVSDGSVTTADTFLLTVNSVNDLPTVSAPGNRTVNEDTGTGAISFTVGDVETPAGNLNLLGVSSNPTLVPSGNIVFGGSGSTRTVAVTPATNQFGIATITVRATDGNGGVGSNSFVLTVNDVNDPPTLGTLSDLSINEDSGTNQITLTVISAGGGESQNLSITATSGNPSVVPHPSVDYTSPSSTGTLRFVPVAEQSGSSLITVTVNDGGATNNTIVRTFTVNVFPVNDAPSVSGLVDVEINEDTATAVLPFTIGDVDSALASLTVAAASSNPSLVPPENVLLTGSGSNRFVQVLPATNAFGTAVITLNVSDGTATRPATFTLTVLPVNDAPAIQPVTGFTLLEDVGTNVTVTVGDLETPAGELTVNVTSSNPTLFPAGSLALSGTGANRSLSIVPATNLAGGANITVVVSDTGGAAATNTFTVNVTAVNDPPSLNPLSDITIAEDAALQTVNLSGIGPGAPNEVAATIQVSVTSGNPGLIPHPTLSYLSPAASGSLTFKPVADANGTTTITVTVNDGGAQNSTTVRMFTVNVTPVNDPPAIVSHPDIILNEDTSTNLVLTVSDPDAAPDTLSVSASSSNEELIDATGLIVSGTSGTRTLQVTPLENQFGTATITVTVSDGDGTSRSMSFNLSVLPVNDPPEITGLANVSIAQDTSTGDIPFIVADQETFPGSVNVTARSSNTNLVPASGIVLGGSGFNRTIRLTPAELQVGTSVITVSASDTDNATNTVSFVLTVRGINIPPTLDPLAPMTIAEDASQQVVTLSGISSGAPRELQPLTVSATSGNPGLIPNPTVNYTSPNSTGELRFTPAANANGLAVITVTVDDGSPDDATFSRTFTVTVTPLNDPPSIATIPNVSTAKSLPTGEIPVLLSDLESPASSLTLSASSSNTGLVANASIVFGGSGANRTVVITPAPNLVGSAFITIAATDPEGLTGTQMFRLTVLPTDYPPTISQIGPVEFAEDTQRLVNFTIGDPENNPGELIVTALSSLPSLIPPEGLIVGGTGAARSVTLVPRLNRFGSATITVLVTDTNGTATSRDFVATVTPVNDAPSVAGLSNITIEEGRPSGALGFVIHDEETPAGDLVVSATSQNTTIIPNGNLVLGGAGANRTLTITPVNGQAGSVPVTVTVADGNGGSGNVSFTVTVTPFNDPPTLNAINDLTINEDAGLQTVPLAGISAGPNETQPLIVTATSSNPSVVPHPVVTYSSPAATGSLGITPVEHASGSAVITVSLSDGQTGGTITRSFGVTVNPVNDAPVVSAFASQQTQEDVPLVVPFTLRDPDHPVANLTLTGTSSNLVLVPNGNISFNGSGSNRTVTVVPALHQFGTTLITVQAGDGLQSGSSSFLLTVVSVNDPPTLDPIPPFATNASGANPSYTINLSGIGAGGTTEVQALTITATSSNPTFLPDPVVTYSSPATTGSLRLRPGNNVTGSAVVTVTVTDNGTGSNSFVRTFPVTIKPSANVLPTISLINNQNINEDTSTGALPFTVRDAETTASALTLSVASSNPLLFPASNLVLGGSGTNRTLTVTSAANLSGSAAITLRVVDPSFGASNMTFNVTVNAVNDAPTISGIANQTVARNSSTAPLTFAVGDLETNPGALVITGSSTDLLLVPVSNIRVGGTGADRSVVITPASNRVGTARITLTVSDGTASANASFDLTVNPINESPSISDLPDQTISEDGTMGPVPFVVGDAETLPASLTVSGASSDPELVPPGNIVFGGSGANRTVSVTPAANAFGSATITIAVNDGTASVNDTFVLTVSPANDSPTLNPIADRTLRATGGLQTMDLSAISSGAANETAPVVLSASSSAPAIVPHPTITYSSPASTGTLTFSVPGDVSGSAVVTVTVNDGQSGNNTVSRSFTVTVDRPPEISVIPDQILSEDGSSSGIAFTVSDVETAASALVVSATSSNPSVVNNTGLAVGGNSGSRTLTVTPVANASGSTWLTVTAADLAGNVTSNRFLLTVRPVNDRPTLDPIGNRDTSPSPIAHSVTLSGIGSGAPNEQERLSVTAVSDRPSIIPDPAIAYISPATGGTLTFTPSGTATGLVTISVTVMDEAFDDGSGSNRVTRTFQVNVTGPTSGAGLAIELQGGGNVRVSWPDTFNPSYVLQSTTNPMDPSSWANTLDAPSLAGGRYAVVQPHSGAQRFYRLCEGCGSPALAIVLSGGNVIISWPVAGSSGYVLQSSSSVAAVPASWGNVTQSPQDVAGRRQVTLDASSGGGRFYRLCNGCGN